MISPASRRVLATFLFILLPVLALTSVLITVSHKSRPAPPAVPISNVEWNWGSTKTVFALGDSFTTTGYEDASGTWHAETSSGGPIWVQFLTSTYNTSGPMTLWNRADSGAEIVHVEQNDPEIRTKLSLEEQVDALRSYAGMDEGAQYGREALCVVWIGINDVINTFFLPSAASIHASRFALLSDLLIPLLPPSPNPACNHLLLLTLPPLHILPYFRARHSKLDLRALEAAVGSWNDALFRLAGNLPGVGVFDVTGFFGTLITHGPALGFGPAGEGLFRDGFHPTWVVHNLLAFAVGRFLGGRYGEE